ncbi:MAG: DUF2332 family protein, partial [Novosphingobium sp.]
MSIEKQTVYATAGMPVAAAYANQVDYCHANGAPITARIVAAVGGLLEQADGNLFLQRIRDWPGNALGDAVPLRSAGGLHALHLAGGEMELARIYRDEAADDRRIVGEVIARRQAELLPWLDGPPQTNEAGRSSGFIAALLWLAEQGLPPQFACLEV